MAKMSTETDLSPERIKLMEEQAEAGDISAQIYLGFIYSKHGGWHRDDGKAEHWLRRAAKSGDIEGLRRLARFLKDAENVETIEIVTELLKRDDFYGHYIVAHLYKHGSLGFSKNRQKALDHFRRASDLGHLVSRFDYLKTDGFSKPKNIFLAAGVLVRAFSAKWKDRNSQATYT